MFTNFNEVSNHIQSNHAEAVVKVVKCFECKKELPKDHEAIKNHMRSEHMPRQEIGLPNHVQSEKRQKVRYTYLVFLKSLVEFEPFFTII